MARFLHQDVSLFLRKWGNQILALSWLSGLLLGNALCRDAGTTFASLMLTTVSCRVSITGLLVSVLLPFLFSAAAVYLSQPLAFVLILFIKAVFFSFVSCGVSAAFGSAGWLVWLLLLFQDIVASVLLIMYALRHISGVRVFSFREAGVFGLCYILLAGIQFQFISPFLSELII